MSRSSPSLKVDEELLASAEAEFKAVESAIEEFSKHADDADTALPKALEAIFEFVQQRDDKVLEAFVRRHKGRWGGTAKKNRFQPVVRLAFGKRSEPSHSKYATVLKFVTTQELGNGTLADWLQKQGTFTEAYKKAVATTRSSNASDKDGTEAARIAVMKARLKSRPLSHPFTLSRATGVDNGFIIALIHVEKTETGERGYVSHILETDEAAVNKRILSLTRSDLTEDFALYGDRLLYPLYRAVICLSTLLCHAHSSDITGHQIAVDNRHPQSTKGTRVFTRISSKLDPFGEIALGAPIPGVSRTRQFAFSPAEAEQFLDGFRKYPKLAVRDDPERKSIVFYDDNDGSSVVTVGTDRLQLGSIRQIPTSSERYAPQEVVLPESAMKRIANELRKNVGDTQENAHASFMPLALSGSKIAVTINGGSKLLLKTTNSTAAHPLSLDASIRTDVLARLCAALAPYRNDITGELRTHEEGNLSLVLQHAFDQDALALAIPLASSSSPR